jgi:hypothetical protein
VWTGTIYFVLQPVNLRPTEIGTEYSMAREKYFGKYRCVVIDNADPLNQVRILARVSEILGDVVTVWALPCIPFAGVGLGF